MQTCRCDPPCVPKYKGAPRSVRHHHKQQREKGINVPKAKPGKKKNLDVSTCPDDLGQDSLQIEITVVTADHDPFE